jgi:predicted nucleic acid-binding protein
MSSDRGWIEKTEDAVVIHAPTAKWPPVNDDSIHVYLDTCLVSGWAKRDLAPLEQEALWQLRKLDDAGSITLMTSEVTKEELAALPADARKLHEDIYDSLRKVPMSPEAAVQVTGRRPTLGFLGWSLPEETLATLLQLVPDPNDARHLVHALKAGCDFFVTTDHKTIVSKREPVEARFSPLRIRKPSELVGELAA